MATYGKNELIRRLSDYMRKGWTNQQVKDLIDSLWRDPYSLRTSGFDIPGGTDAGMSFNNNNRKFSITPVYTKFSFYQRILNLTFHKKFSLEYIELPATEGLYAIFYEKDPVTKLQRLAYLYNPTYDEQHVLYLTKCLIAIIYYNSEDSRAEYFGDERHGSEWNPQENWWAQNAFNGIRESGIKINQLNIGDGSLPAHAQFGVSDGTYLHEDVRITIGAVNPGDSIPQFYRSSTNVRRGNATGFAVLNETDGKLFFNYLLTLNECSDKYFTLCHVYATNCVINPVITVMGYYQYETEYDAVMGLEWELDFIKTWLPHKSYLYVGTLIFENNPDFTTGVHARITGEVTPEKIAEIIADEKVPFKKNGWDPEIQDQIDVALDGLDMEITVDTFSLYYSQNKRFKVTENISFPFADVLGLQFAWYDGEEVVVSAEKWDDYQETLAIMFAIYWNTRKQQEMFLGWYFFMWEMEANTRGNQIKVSGLELVTGLQVTQGVDPGYTHEVNVSEGSIRLADILADIQNTGGPNAAGYFDMYLQTLEARRYYIKTYRIEDPQNPPEEIITHEWEYQSDQPAYIATLSAGNEVVINEKDENEDWVLSETADGEYSAVWLIACLDYAQPLKWITGQYKGATKDEAKELNDEQSLIDIIEGAQFFTPHYAVVARVIVKNILAEPYYEISEIEQYNDGDFTDELEDKYVTAAGFNNGTRMLTLKRSSKLQDLVVEIPGGSTTDELVKYNADDPAAGYLSEKIIAGDNITIGEGTGANENKVKISASCNIAGITQNITGGYLYNWWAASDARNMAPVGWKVPDPSDFVTLANTLGGETIAGGKLKETGTTYWDSPNTGATNEFGFNGRGAGDRSTVFSSIKLVLTLWTKEEVSSSNGYISVLNYNTENFGTGTTQTTKYKGASVRWLCESSVDPGFVIGNDGVRYPTVKIGTQVWTACNVIETKYRNGNLISGPTYTDLAWVALTTEAYCIYNDDPANAYENSAILHNFLAGLQGGNETERYHHTADEISDHVYEAPVDGKIYVRKNGEWVEITFPETILVDKDFEFCVNAGTAETFKIDPSAAYGYTITKVKLESDGTLTGVSVKIGVTAVTGLSAMSVSTMASFSATAANVVVEDDVVTINTSVNYSGSPTVIRGKIVFTV